MRKSFAPHLQAHPQLVLYLSQHAGLGKLALRGRCGRSERRPSQLEVGTGGARCPNIASHLWRHPALAGAIVRTATNIRSAAVTSASHTTPLERCFWILSSSVFISRQPTLRRAFGDRKGLLKHLLRFKRGVLTILLKHPLGNNLTLSTGRKLGMGRPRHLAPNRRVRNRKNGSCCKFSKQRIK